MRTKSQRVAPSCLVLIVAITILVFPPARSWAQVTAAAISGTVKDESGAVIQSATLKLTSLETGQTRAATSDAAGRYTFPSLNVGRHELRVEAAGFQTSVWKDVQLEVGQTAILDFVLKVSPVALELTVTAPAPLLNFTSGELSYLVDEKKIEDLPLNGRNFTDLALLQPGVQAFRNRQGGSIVATGLMININGQEGRSNVYLLDGTLANNVTNGPAGSAANTALGVEAVREFRVETNAYSAEFGRNMGGQINAITKSGTNVLQGSVFEYHRNDNLDARNFFDREKPEFKRNQFGFSLGGPIRKDRTHFFATYEGLRENLGRTITSTTPDENARKGLLPDASRPGQFIDVGVKAEAKPYLDLFPLPNGQNLGSGLAQYIWTFPQTTNVDFLQFRLDHQLSQADTIFGRFTIDDAEQNRSTAFPQFPNPFLSRNQFLTLQYLNNLTPQLFQTLRFGYSRTNIGQDVAANLGTSVSSFIQGRPIIGDIDIGGIPRFGPQVTANFRGIQNVFSFSDDLNYIRGKHALKMGALVERYQANIYNPTFSLGIFTFSDLRGFLENRPLRFLGMTPQSTFDRYWRSTLLGFYVQDELRFLSNLTLTFGLRHEFATVPLDRQGRDSTLVRITDADVTIGPPFRTSYWKRFAPRVGFAWDPFGKGETSIRGGFGMFFNTQLQQNLLVTLGNLPAAERFVIPSPTFPVATFRPGLGRSLRPFEYNLKIPNALVWNLSIQQELGDHTLVTVGYAGSRGLHLIRAGDVNTVNPQVQSDGSLLFPAGARRPNTAWGTIELRRGDGNSWYNALVFEARRRFSRGHQYQASYTFSRSIDTTQGATFFSDSTSSTVVAFPDFGELRYNKGLSDFHAAHNFVLNYTWDLPFFANGDAARRAVLGDWQLGGILNLQSGNPLTVFIAANRSRSLWSPSINPATGFDRPSVVAGRTNIVAGNPSNYFDKSAFLLPEAGRLGNVGRNSFIGPGLATLDVSLGKKFRLREGVTLQFRTEFFNLLNRANFGPPDLVAFAGARDGESVLPTFGRIRDTITPSRQIQFGLRIIF